MLLTFGSKTDVGRKRHHNEDCCLIDPRLGLFLVCDGMGGRNAGEVASSMAVEIIQKHIREASRNGNLSFIGEPDEKFSAQTNRLASAIRLANQVINGAAKSKPDQSGMGTTVVSGMVGGGVLSVAHAGDSRMYLIRGGKAQPLTADHSLVAELVRRGKMTEEEAAASSQKNIITRALGVEETIDVELDEQPIMSGDVLLLCSDGLTRYLKPDEFVKVLRTAKDLQEGAERLVELANEAGGEDNVTVILVRVQKEAKRGLWQRFWGRW
jgi:protein phosphatase